jgi:hypothetical protein
MNNIDFYRQQLKNHFPHLSLQDVVLNRQGQYNDVLIINEFGKHTLDTDLQRTIREAYNVEQIGRMFNPLTPLAGGRSTNAFVRERGTT